VTDTEPRPLQLRIYCGNELVALWRRRSDGRYQRRVHTRILSRSQVDEWVETARADPPYRLRGRKWRVEEVDDDTRP
jgi:hypothetical protein